MWDNPDQAQTIVRKSKHLQQEVNRHDEFVSRLEDLETLIEMAEEEKDSSESAEIDKELSLLQKQIDSYELECTLSNENDANNCFLTIHPGAGGTESCDWAEMLYRMYIRYFELKGYDVEILDYQPGDEAGAKSVTMLVKGSYTYGRLKGEHGVHRLVRISPFDSQSRRHTSFTSVTVIPELEEDVDVEINDKDLRIDTYRASGAGGQHVNKTDSAIRITHLPTGTVVCCQNERSQIKNRATAFKILRSRLYDLQVKEQEQKVAAATGEKKDIAWGSQIRSYVFCPYTMVKDLRTGCETSNVQAVMDGDLDPFIESYLRWLISNSS